MERCGYIPCSPLTALSEVSGLESNDEEIIINTLDDARLITVSATSNSGKEHTFKYSVNQSSFDKEKEWLFNCMKKDKEYLKYLKKSLLKFL